MHILLSLILAAAPPERFPPPPPDPIVRACDLHRFPPREVVRYHRRIAMECRDHLERRAVMMPRPETMAAWQDGAMLYRAWDALDDAHIWRESNPQWSLNALVRLRLLIGDAAYRRADMPPPVPPWRFGGGD